MNPHLSEEDVEQILEDVEASLTAPLRFRCQKPMFVTDSLPDAGGFNVTIHGKRQAYISGLHLTRVIWWWANCWVQPKETDIQYWEGVRAALKYAKHPEARWPKKPERCAPRMRTPEEMKALLKDNTCSHLCNNLGSVGKFNINPNHLCMVSQTRA